MGVRLYKHALKSPTKTAQFWWDLLFRQLVLSAGVQNYFLDLFFQRVTPIKKYLRILGQVSLPSFFKGIRHLYPHGY